MWPAIISAGASLIGGALSRKTAKKERASHFVNLRASAEAGGFNPLTVLRATQGGGYGNYAAQLSRSPFENALNDGAQAFQQYSRDTRTMAHETTLQNNRQSHEMKLSRAQNAAFASGLNSGRGNGEASERMALEVGDVTTTPADASNTQAVEDRYGDLVGWIYGAGLLAADAGSTLGSLADPYIGGDLSKPRGERLGWHSPLTRNPAVPTLESQMPKGWENWIPWGTAKPLSIEINRSHVPNPRRPN